MRNSSRREALRVMLLSGLGLAVCSGTRGANRLPDADSVGDLLADLETPSIAAKVQAVQAILERVGFGPTGIMYSMQRLERDTIRPFRASDFPGKTSLDASVGKLQLDGPQDYLHGENSITQSGLYLAAQCFRYQATRSPEALEQAARAFRSLDLVYRMGEQEGKPGWMGKPYGFRPSLQTSGDQYCDATWGLFAYHDIAPSADQKRIKQMLIGFADYWRSVDYVLTYFGSTWDQKGDTGSYNAIYAAINAVAYHFSRAPVHRQEFEKWMRVGTWMRETRIDALRQQFQAQVQQTGKAEVIPYGVCYRLVKDLLQPGEFLCWETTIHSKFVVVAMDMIRKVLPDALPGDPGQAMARWWREWKYGTGEDLLPYYWFAVNLANDTWRPLPATPLLPREEWLFGDPFTSYVSQVRWMEPLARFLIVSALAAEGAPEVQHDAQRLATRMMTHVDWRRLHWLYDPDGKQLLPEISYCGECLSSEMPASFLAAYWRGKHAGLW